MTERTEMTEFMEMTEKEYALAEAVRKREAVRNVGVQDLEATQLVSLDDLIELERLQLAGAAHAEPALGRRRATVLAAVSGLVLAAVLLATLLVVVHACREAQPAAGPTLHWGGH